MNKISCMTLGFFNEMVFPYTKDGNLASLRERYLKLLEDIRKAGYAAIDIASFEIKLMGEDFLEQQLKEKNLALASVVHIDDFTSEEARGEVIDNTCKVIDVARRLGAKTFMLVPSSERVKKLPSEGIRTGIEKCWQPIVQYALKYGLTPVMEDSPDTELHLTTSEEVRKILLAVDGLKLAYDSANMMFGGEDSVHFLHSFPREMIGHVHIKDIRITEKLVESGERLADGREVENVFIGAGEVDIQAVVSGLKNMGYDGYYTVEFAPKENATRCIELTQCRNYIDKLL